MLCFESKALDEWQIACLGRVKIFHTIYAYIFYGAQSDSFDFFKSLFYFHFIQYYEGAILALSENSPVMIGLIR